MRKPRHSRLSAGVGVQTHCAVFHLPIVVTMSMCAPQHRIKWNGACQVPSACRIVYLQSVRDIFLLVVRRLLFSSSFEQEIETNRTFSDLILPPNPHPCLTVSFLCLRKPGITFYLEEQNWKRVGHRYRIYICKLIPCVKEGAVFSKCHTGDVQSWKFLPYPFVFELYFVHSMPQRSERAFFVEFLQESIHLTITSRKTRRESFQWKFH